jgi:iron complex transport system substrate-binding protein
MKQLFTLVGLCCVVSLLATPVFAQGISVQDDLGNTITLAQPAQRIVSLAPAITEVLFDAGAGERVVGTVEYSDYPAQAKQIPRVGRHNALDLERIISLRPDLVIAWDSGNPKHQVKRLQQLGLTVFRSEPRQLSTIAETLRRFGRLAGTQAQAEEGAQQFLQRYHALEAQYQNRPTLRVFYQIWDRPLMTLNGEHVVSEIIKLCGGVNVFATLPTLSPTVTTEAVIAANPQVIIATSTDRTLPRSLLRWRQWRQVPAVQHNNLFAIHPDIISRHTPRILDGVQRLCEILDAARLNIGAEYAEP